MFFCKKKGGNLPKKYINLLSYQIIIAPFGFLLILITMTSAKASTAPVDSPLYFMQKAVDLVGTSPHPHNKIAATLFGGNPSDLWSVTRTNHWPAMIDVKIGRTQDIGNSSGTLHAETACILTVPEATEGASLCITDPCCPNCAKNIAEAGIKKIYIDHKGFKKDFFKRRGDHFDSMSMQICAKAGVSVYELNRKEQKITPIIETPDSFVPPNDSPIVIEPIESAAEAVLRIGVQKSSIIHHRRKFAMAFAQNPQGQKFMITARAHAVIGFTMNNLDEALDIMTPQDKYSFIQEPVNRLLMFLARKGWRLIDGYLYASQIPTAREQVNLVGAGIKRITVGDFQKSRDPYGFQAMETLKRVGILIYD